MSEFEVGDRVRCIGAVSHINEVDSFLEKGKEYEISGFRSRDGYIRFNELFGYSLRPSRFELISKGEDSMQDLNAIAVEVDDEDLREAIVNKARKNGWYIGTTDNASASRWPELHFTLSNVSKNDHKTVYKSNSTGNIKHLGKLSENWNKVVEFLEQESQPTPTLNGREAEIDKVHGSWEIEVGCWSGTWTKLQGFKTYAEDIGITSGTVTIKGEEIDIEELYQFIEEVRGVVKD